MRTTWTECKIGRYFLGPSGTIIVGISIIGQIALIYTLKTSTTYNRNVCYQTMMMIGILNLIQLACQFEVFLDNLYCKSINPTADIFFAGLGCRMTICTIEIYNLVLALNRIVILLLPPQQYENQINKLHKFLNYTIWLVNIPIWIAIFHPSCIPVYESFSPQMADGCVSRDFLALFDEFRNYVFITNFFVYISLLVGMRMKYADKEVGSLNSMGKRILATSMGQFLSLGLITIMTTYFEPFIEDQLVGKVVFRVIRASYPVLNVSLIYILDRPLRDRILRRKINGAFSSAVLVVNQQRPMTAKANSDQTI